REQFVTGRPIVAEQLRCIRWDILSQVSYLWREVNSILHQRQDAEACAGDSRIARDGWDGCLREREVLSLASPDEDREPEGNATRISRRRLRMEQLRPYVLRVRGPRLNIVLYSWCELFPERVRRGLRSVSMARVALDKETSCRGADACGLVRSSPD
ncbi:hypothetical protein N9L68_08010, partial [bacterium]|nr:hypothetical protein [bacterium]